MNQDQPSDKIVRTEFPCPYCNGKLQHVKNCPQQILGELAKPLTIFEPLPAKQNDWVRERYTCPSWSCSICGKPGVSGVCRECAEDYS